MTKRFHSHFISSKESNVIGNLVDILGQYQVAEKRSLKPEIILNKISEELCKEQRITESINMEKVT